MATLGNFNGNITMDPQELTVWTLVNPPQGKSLADDYCERCNTWMYKKMKKTCSSLQREVEDKSVKYRKEQEKLVQELSRIRNINRRKTKDLEASQFLVNEKRLVQSSKAKYRNIHEELKDWPSKCLHPRRATDCFNETDSATGSDSETELPVQPPNCLPSKYTKEMKYKDERLHNFYRRYSAHSNPELQRLKTLVKA